jgi:hypothetical protein
MVYDQQNRLLQPDAKDAEKENGCLRSMTQLRKCYIPGRFWEEAESLYRMQLNPGLNNEQAGSSFTSSGLTVYYKEEYLIYL